MEEGKQGATVAVGEVKARERRGREWNLGGYSPERTRTKTLTLVETGYVCKIKGTL